jgi:hypothetical protein
VIFALIALVAFVGFFGLMVAASELGWRIGRAWLARHAGELAKGAGSAEAAVLGLFGLLIAFPFSGAASRFEDMAFSTVQRQGLPTPTTTLLLGSRNEMIDITTQHMATRNHPPLIVCVMLGVLSLVCSTLVGYCISQNPTRSWLHSLTFAAVVSLTVYVIVDLELPRVGLVRVDSADVVLAELRESIQ